MAAKSRIDIGQMRVNDLRNNASKLLKTLIIMETTTLKLYSLEYKEAKTYLMAALFIAGNIVLWDSEALRRILLMQLRWQHRIALK